MQKNEFANLHNMSPSDHFKDSLAAKVKEDGIDEDKIKTKTERTKNNFLDKFIKSQDDEIDINFSKENVDFTCPLCQSFNG